MAFRVYIDGREFLADSIVDASSSLQEYVAGMEADGRPVSHWWGRIVRESDVRFRLVWFDAGGVYHCTPWLSC